MTLFRILKNIHHKFKHWDGGDDDFGKALNLLQPEGEATLLVALTFMCHVSCFFKLKNTKHTTYFCYKKVKIYFTVFEFEKLLKQTFLWFYTAAL